MSAIVMGCIIMSTIHRYADRDDWAAVWMLLGLVALGIQIGVAL